MAPDSTEVVLLDKFIQKHASVYVLQGQEYQSLLELLLQNRIYNAKWQYGTATRQHLIRVLQTVRILSREPGLIEILISQNGI